MPGALEGVRIIDVTQVISGPLATRILAEQGADVIKVETPAGDVLPVFSPDGSHLMWTSTRTKTHASQLFIAKFKLPE